MKQKLTGIFLGLAALAFSSSAASAQGFTGGAKLGYDMYFGTTFKPLTLGAFGEYIRDSESSGIRFMFEYSLPKSFDDSYTAYALSSATDPQYITVNGRTKISGFNLAVDYRNFFGDGEYSEGGFYGYFGAGFTLVSTKTSLDFAGYSTNDYSVSGFNGKENTERFPQFMIRGGLGYELDLDPAKLFAEARLSFPANRVSGVAVGINIGPFAGLSAGIRF